MIQLDRRTIFLVDSAGALISALILGLIFPPFDLFFGIPKLVSYALGGVAFALCLFSTTCFLSQWWKRSFSLGLIITANICYCLASAVMVYLYLSDITIFGLTYFILEIAVIFTIVAAELTLFFEQL